MLLVFVPTNPKGGQLQSFLLTAALVYALVSNRRLLTRHGGASAWGARHVDV